jgi:hypothetical protein
MCLPCSTMGRWGLAIGLAWTVALWGWIPPASASVLCRDVEGQQVCIESIQRSAKYLWEYRVVVAVDGQKQPLKVYDCRSKAAADKASSIEAAMEAFICNLVNR